MNKRKRKLVFLVLILAALALLLISQLLLAIPINRIALKAPEENRDYKDILEITQRLTQTVESIYASVNQTLTALPLAGSQTAEKTLSLTAAPDFAELSATPRPEKTATPQLSLQTATEDETGRTPTPSFTPKPTRTANLTPQTDSPTGNIPGLTPNIVISFLANGLFECQEKQVDPLGIHSWSCSQSSQQHEILVTIYSRSEDTVDMIEVIAVPSTALISQPTISKIALIASLPYINADQQAAQDWILDNIPALTQETPSEAGQVFGNVIFYLIYEDPDWVLYMGDLFE